MSNDNHIRKFGEGLRPVPRMSVWEWADRYRILSTSTSAEPGKYRTDRTPYLRRIMDCLSVTAPYKKIILMKGAQVGATEAATNFIGYAIHLSPAPILFVQPTEEMIMRTSKVRITPLIELCPELNDRVSKNKSRDSKNTIMQKNFNGGTLYFAGANSPAGLSSVPIRYLLLDEVDRYPQDAGGEGSPVELAIARTRTFPNKKIFINSTPTITGLSVIEAEFEATDQHYYHVPCPFCGTLQPLEFPRLVWPDGKPRGAKYQCVHCEKLIPERYKAQMLTAGRWIPKCPENSGDEIIGFHLNSLYSPLGWYSWGEIAENFIKAKDSPNQLKAFVNTTLGETWKEKGEAPPYKNLYNRREDYPLNHVPNDVCFLTAGVDVQRDRIELEIVGWCTDKRSYSIDYRTLDGDTAKAEVWDRLAEVVGERWVVRGAELPLLKMAVDTGFETNRVYTFCRRFTGGRVVPVKGQDALRMAYSPPKSIDVAKSGKRIGKVRLYNVGVSFLKEEIYSLLRLEKDSAGVPPPGYCHFPQYEEHYFRGLTAEQYVKKTVRGYTRYYWVKMYDRNEALDCRVYARAAAAMVGLDRKTPEQLEALAGRTTQKKSAGQPRKRRTESSFWD